jgi:hypothetical protein
MVCSLGSVRAFQAPAPAAASKPISTSNKALAQYPWVQAAIIFIVTTDGNIGWSVRFNPNFDDLIGRNPVSMRVAVYFLVIFVAM